MIPLLVLRPEPGASQTEARAQALGLAVLKRPLFETEALPWFAPDPAGFDAVLMTSANAARFGGDQLQLFAHLPLYAVGPVTAQAARVAGFGDVRVSDTDAQAAIDRMARDECARALHIAGTDRVAVEARIELAPVAVYTARACNAQLPAQPVVALVHSPRAAQRFAELSPNKAAVDLVAISSKVAELAGTGWRSLNHAKIPSDEAMLALAAPLCKRSG